MNSSDDIVFKGDKTFRREEPGFGYAAPVRLSLLAETCLSRCEETPGEPEKWADALNTQALRHSPETSSHNL
jgi:hypothetical protein